jgi:hypothetical protein
MTFRTERKKEILRRRQRRYKLLKLRAKLAAAGSKTEQQKIIEKIHKISPFYKLPTDK